MESKIVLNKNFGKVSASRAREANKRIGQIMQSGKTVEWKANAIIKEFEKAYKGSGLEGIWQSKKPEFLKMIKGNIAPCVSDRDPWKR